jgi:hypothetical protein
MNVTPGQASLVSPPWISDEEVRELESERGVLSSVP